MINEPTMFEALTELLNTGQGPIRFEVMRPPGPWQYNECTGVGVDPIGTGCAYFDSGSCRVYWIPGDTCTLSDECTAQDADKDPIEELKAELDG